MEECKNCKSLSQRLSQAEKDIETWKIVAKGEENMRLEDERKLSQAEAENKHIKGDCGLCHPAEHELKIKDLEARLSHLMEVGGKLKSALELFTDRYDTWIKRGFTEYSDGHLVDWNPVGHYRKAKLSIALWDGIKEGGK
jgi:hypothetical protein